MNWSPYQNFSLRKFQLTYQTDKESEHHNISRSGRDFSNLLDSEGGISRLFRGIVIEAPIPQVSFDNMLENCVDKVMPSMRMERS